MFRRLQEFWAQGIAQKIAIVSVASTIALCTCCGGAVAVSAALASSEPSVGQAPTYTVAVQQATATTVTSTPTYVATPAPQVSHYPPKTRDDLISRGGQWL